MATPAEKARDKTAKIKEVIEENVDTEKLKETFDVSNFGANAVLRGMQLTLVGAHRAMQNPAIFTNEHYKQAAIAVAVGVAIRILVSLPVFGIKTMLWSASFFTNLDSVSWDDTIVNGLHFIEEYVLQVPFFLMTLMRYIDPTLDNLFMQSLNWVDVTYVKKHERDDPNDLRDMYYPNLKAYDRGANNNVPHKKGNKGPILRFIYRFARKGAISLAIFALSYIPYIGRLVLPAASFYTFNNAVGMGPATLIFSTGVFLPRRYLVIFLQTYFSSRSLMRELLEPYFARVRFTKEQKKKWFRSREGVLFGFGLGFYLLVRVPLVGVLIYGIAEASTAYLITKITDPPPPPQQMEEFTASQQQWRNKHEFLSLSLMNMDHLPQEKSNKTVQKTS